MKFAVLGGSPKGEVSVTLQAVYWLRKQFPQHQFEIRCIAREIKKLERDETSFWDVVKEMEEADGILWAYPLYYGLVHSGVKRFIELLNEREREGRTAADSLKGKHTALYSTSIHFYDHTALEYMRGVCEDMGMQVDDGFSAGMRDLLDEQGRTQLRLFFEKWVGDIQEDVKKSRLTEPVRWGEEKTPMLKGRPSQVYRMKVGIVTESGKSSSLDEMVQRAAMSFEEVELFDLSGMKIAGSCLGCLNCGYDNKCVYEGKDQVIETHRKLRQCDALLFCGAVTDRFLSARWTSFINRLFFATHMPFYTGMPVGYIFSGPYRQLSAMKDIFTGLFTCFEMVMAGTVTDEGENAAAEIEGLAASLHFHKERGYCQPPTFHAVGGKHIFRDEIFSNLKGVFCADHKYYKKNGLYDFPHKKLGERFAATGMYLGMKLSPMRKEVQSNMAKYMVQPYQKLY